MLLPADIAPSQEPLKQFSAAVANGYVDASIWSTDGEYRIGFRVSRRDLDAPRYRESDTFTCDELLALARIATQAWDWIQDDLR